MFTGIIEATAKVISSKEGVLTLERPASFTDITEGASIAISGVCLTVVGMTNTEMAFNVVPETLAKTSLGSKQPGDLVHLERALPANGRLDGHVVQGHVEGVCVVVSVSFSSIPRPLPPVQGLRAPQGLERPGEEGESPSSCKGTEEKERRGVTPSGILEFSREMRSNPTKAEELFWEAVRYDVLGVRVRRQYRIGVCIVDFYLPALHLAIEIDGGYHAAADQQRDDALRTDYFTKVYKVHVLRFQNDEVIHHLDRVLDTLRSWIESHASPPPTEEGLGVEETTKKQNILALRIPEPLLPFVARKGSITVEGVALTVIDVEGDVALIALIPATVRGTTLGNLKPGDRVNIETDVLARYVARLLPYLLASQR